LRAFKSADADPSVPKDPLARQALLRRGLIPWLAGIDPDSGAARRRVARLSEIPAEARQLIQHFVEQRLLATDVARDSKEQTIEPAHEAVLRQWDLLQGWLTEDSGLLTVLDGVKRAARDWARNGKSAAWLTHVTGRLEAAGQLGERRDLASQLSPLDREYLATCRKAEAASKARRRSLQGLIYVLLVGIIAGLVGWIEQAQIKAELYWYAYMRPYMQRDVRPYVLTAAAEQNLTPLSSFRECAKDCPEMIVVPAGAFTMGSPETPSNDPNHYADEYPQHAVTLAAPFAVSKFDVTFADWDACVSVGGCPEVSDSGFGRGPRPVINVTWDEAEHYAEWYATMTGRPYRLLSEAEWEYAARAGTPTAYYWGDSIGVNNADCNGCGSKWDNRQTAPVGSFAPNRFGLYDMSGNVWQWTQDCYHDSYNGAPNDGSAWLADDCSRRVRRGGGWAYNPPIVRSANRGADSPVNQSAFVGFRIGRALAH
jgi:formylglycine-generating enzyme required for sulfatase activity